jgi:hypothetical protein
MVTAGVLVLLFAIIPLPKVEMPRCFLSFSGVLRSFSCAALIEQVPINNPIVCSSSSNKMALPTHRFPRNTVVRLNDAAIEGSNLTIHGDRNTISANYSTIFGSNNFINASSATVTGNNNHVASNYATVTGNSNTVNGSSPKVNGNVNNVRGSYPKVNGDSNNVSGSSPRVNGHGNRVTGDYGTVRGNNNTVHGNSSSANGDQNVISGRYASANGSSSNVTGEHSRASGGNNNTVTGENAFASTGGNNTVNGVSAEQERQRHQHGLEQRIQQLQQQPRQQDDFPHELEVQSLLFQHQVLQLHGPLQQRQPQQPAPAPVLPQQQPVPPPPLPPHQQPIKLALRGDDEPADEDNENGDSCCSLCYVNKAVVASVCSGKLITCLGCTRILYEGKMVGQEKCLNCQRHVEHVVRIS